jgi:glycolate oxidase FAD binding subunit
MTPQTEAELAEIIASAPSPLAIKGGGTRGFGVPGADVSLSEMGGIKLYDPGALTIVLGAGTALSEVNAALAQENQRLPFEPMDHRGLLGTSGEPTIGGVIAANVSGPRRVVSGAARDFMLGVRFVDGTGTVLKNGGRVMKNVTGYDLVKLMSGSYGTLGVITEVALKVLPRPDMAACVVLEGLNNAAAVRALSAALGSPFEVSGAAHVPSGPDRGARTLVRIEGFAESVRYRTGKLQKLLGDYGPAEVETDPDRVADMWDAVRDVAPFHAATGDVWRISCTPSMGPDLVARAQALDVMFDWGGGLIWALTAPGTDLRPRLGDYEGHATLIRADRATRDKLGVFQPQSAGVAALSAGLRAKFDPRNILNTGLMQTRAKV